MLACLFSQGASPPRSLLNYCLRMAWLGLSALAVVVALAWVKLEHTPIGTALSWTVAVAILIAIMAALVLAMAAGVRLVQ